MTPIDWYNKQRKEYQERYGTQWRHLSMYGDNQDSDVCETAMRSGIECRRLQPTNSAEIEMIANAIMIRDYIKQLHNSPREIA